MKKKKNFFFSFSFSVAFINLIFRDFFPLIMYDCVFNINQVISYSKMIDKDGRINWCKYVNYILY
jgi:hypothetical protein